MPAILVTDAHTRAALATVRSLGRSGSRVVTVAEHLPALASVSRYAAASAPVPSALRDPAAFIDAVREVASTHGVDVVVPVTDAATTALLGADLGAPVVAGPSPAAYETLSNKAALLERAAAAGLLVPRSIVAETAAELLAAVRSVGQPCVLKPHRSVVGDLGGAASLGVRRVSRESDLAPPLPASAFPVVVQEWVPGTGEGLFFLMDHGRTVVAFAHRRLREKPPGGGVSVYREAIALPQDTLMGAERLLTDVGWHGAAMVEFRRTPAVGPCRGKSYLMEVNGRLWGSLQLAIDAGVDFPALLVNLALGRHLDAIGAYRVGVRSRWFWGDVDHLLARLRRGRAALGLGPEAPSRARVVLDFLRIRRRDRFEVFDLSDPRPFLRESLHWLRGGSA